MALDVISSAAGWQAQLGSSLQSNWQNVLGAAAKALGMSASSISSQLRAGASLSSIAHAQGVSEQTLTDAISGALSPRTQAAASDAERARIATGIANRVGGPHSQADGPDADPDGDGSTSSTNFDLLAMSTAGDSYSASAALTDQSRTDSTVEQLV